MKQPVTSLTEKAPWKQQLRLRLKEGLLILLAALCVFLWMILLSFSTEDPGFTRAVGAGEQIENAGGLVGAWLSDVLFSLLGYFAWLLPFFLMLKVFMMFKGRNQAFVWRPALLVVRSFGLLLLLGSGAALARLHFEQPENSPNNFNIFGKVLAPPLEQLLNVQGATVLLLALFLLGVTLFTNLSWFRVMELVGELTLAAVNWCVVKIRDSRETFYQRRTEQQRQRDIDEKVAQVVAPRITDRDEQNRARERIVRREEQLAKRVQGNAGRKEPVISLPDSSVQQPSRRAMQEKQTSLFVDEVMAGTLPPLSLLDRPKPKKQSYSEESLQGMSRLLEIKLKEFGVEVQVESVHPGPVVTRFEIQLAPGIKVSRISNLAKDLARSLAMLSVRVVEVIPGKTTVGIEIPNEDRQIVRFAEVLETPEFDDAKSPVALGLGHDIGGKPIIADLAKMPHLLVAGTTGSGKSVGVNAMILSILFKSSPDDARLIMIDPKMLELSVYEGIPHLLCPVVTDMKEAANALRWCVAEMDRRYKLMSMLGVRNLAGYNRKVKEAIEAGEPIADPTFKQEHVDDVRPTLDKLPTIVVVVDEFADMIMIVGKKVEELIARIAQKARAAGIHLILATQRPSVDVITGLIKANIPTRIAFQVSSRIDSRTILDEGGAEQLLGHGDMLYLPPGTSLPIRVHGAFVADDEVHRVVDAWKARGAPEYIEEILAGLEESTGSFEGGEDLEDDPLFDEAVRFVTEERRVSISSVQRKFRVGYNRAARIVDAMEAAGVVSSAAHNGSRDVLAPPPVKD